MAIKKLITVALKRCDCAMSVNTMKCKLLQNYAFYSSYEADSNGTHNNLAVS